MTITPAHIERLEEIKKSAESATPGQWYPDHSGTAIADEKSQDPYADWLWIVPPPEDGDEYEAKENDIRHIINWQPKNAILFLEAFKALVVAAEKTKQQLEKCHKYLPTHGSFGCEGIDAYEYAQHLTDEALALAKKALEV
jgi:hypothetical protein